jgi:hypothetical protein
MAKPTSANGYDKQVTENCERVLVTLLRGLGPWKDSVYLVGGLAPRYLVPKPTAGKVPHAGTGDVDSAIWAPRLRISALAAPTSARVWLRAVRKSRSSMRARVWPAFTASLSATRTSAT